MLMPTQSIFLTFGHLKKGVLDRVAGLKYFNVYGPKEWHKGPMRSMVLKAYEQIKKDGKLGLFKS